MLNNYELTQKHYNAMIAICGGLLNLEEDFLDIMKLHKVGTELQKEIIMSLRLSSIPTYKFVNTNTTVLKYIITYLLHKLVHHKEIVDECFLQLERRMTKEYKQKIIGKDEYLSLRRINFEIIKLIEFLCYNEYSLTIFKDNRFLIRKSLL